MKKTKKRKRNPAKAVRLKNFTGTIRINPNKTVSVVGRGKGGGGRSNPSKGKYELTFWGAGMIRRFPKYKRYHPTLASARQTAARIVGILDDPNKGFGGAAAHQPIIYDVATGNQV